MRNWWQLLRENSLSFPRKYLYSKLFLSYSHIYFLQLLVWAQLYKILRKNCEAKFGKRFHFKYGKAAHVFHSGPSLSIKMFITALEVIVLLEVVWSLPPISAFIALILQSILSQYLFVVEIIIALQRETALYSQSGWTVVAAEPPFILLQVNKCIKLV